MPIKPKFMLKYSIIKQTRISTTVGKLIYYITLLKRFQISTYRPKIAIEYYDHTMLSEYRIMGKKHIEVSFTALAPVFLKSYAFLLPALMVANILRKPTR